MTKTRLTLEFPGEGDVSLWVEDDGDIKIRLTSAFQADTVKLTFSEFERIREFVRLELLHT
jgi:hypothetical protein